MVHPYYIMAIETTILPAIMVSVLSVLSNNIYKVINSIYVTSEANMIV